MRFPHRLGRRGPGRLGVGKGWGDVLAIPCYDLPGRICGFEFIGRQAGPEDRLYYSGGLDRLGRAQLQPTPLAEAGLAGGAQLLERDARAGQSVLAVADATLLLRLQVRHFAVSLPMPGRRCCAVDEPSFGPSRWTRPRWPRRWPWTAG